MSRRSSSCPAHYIYSNDFRAIQAFADVYAIAWNVGVAVDMM